MADINYVSPGSLLPNMQGAPAGLAGMLMGQQLNDYRNTMGLQQMISTMGMMKGLNEMEEFKANAPLRESNRAAKIHGNNLDMEFGRDERSTTLAKNKEAAKQAGLLNVFTEATQPGSIEATNAGNQGRVSEQQERVYNNAVEALQFLTYDLDAAGPAGLADLKAKVEELNMPEGLKKFILQARDPEDAKKRVSYAMNSAVNSVEQMRKMRQLEYMDAGRLSRETLKSDTAVTVAQIRAEAQRAVAAIGERAKAMGMTKENFENYMTNMARQRVANGQWTEQQGLEFITASKTYATRLKASGSSSLTDAALSGDPNALQAPKTPPAPTPPPPSNAGNAPPPGSTIIELDSKGNRIQK